MPAWLSDLVAVALRPSNVVAFVLLAGFALLLVRRVRAGTILVGASAALFVLFGFLPTGEALMRPLENRFPFEGHPYDGTGGTPPAGIILLGGFIDADKTAAHRMPVLNDRGDRLVATALLARRFPDARVIVTDGPPRHPSGVRLGAALAGVLLEDMGVAEDRLVLEQEARNTWQNAVYTRRLVAPRPDETWILVTSAFHMPRAVGAFRAAGWSGLHPWPVDYQSDGAPRLLNPSAAQGMTLVNLAVREYVALIGYWLAGRSSALFPGPKAPGASPA